MCSGAGICKSGDDNGHSSGNCDETDGHATESSL